MIRKHNILPGLTLIVIAVAMMGSAMGLIPNVPWFRLLISIIFVAGAIKSLLKLDFFGTLFSASIVAWIFEEELKIEHLAPFPLVVAAILLGIGLNMIFKRRQRLVTIGYEDGHGRYVEGNVDEVRKEEWQDGRTVVLENLFNSTSKYVNSTSFSSAKLENTFGSANVYFDNATVYNGEATIDLENSFGKMNIYLPSKWRAQIHQESAFGHVRIYGEPNRDMAAPLVIINAESNFGELNIFFDQRNVDIRKGIVV